MQYGYWHYLKTQGDDLFTMAMFPEREGTFPILVIRSPYVDQYETAEEEQILAETMQAHRLWLDNGYAVVYQHCRGRGKSEGDCIPYIHEREDGLALLDWVRQSAFYNGELYLVGSSYLSSVHYATAPYADDIKGAIFNVQDCERYNICYRNGFLKVGLHGNWYAKDMYKQKTLKNKNITDRSFEILPLSDFTRTVFGEPAEDFDQLLKHPFPGDAFWDTRYGGADARDAIQSAKFPILLKTGMFDIYTGGIFDMWRNMEPNTRQNSALVVTAYCHGDGPPANSITFPEGSCAEHFGSDLQLEWLEHIRKKSQPPVPTGRITYYSLFEDRWKCDAFKESGKICCLPLGNTAVTYRYDPLDAPAFPGGLCCNFGGAVYQHLPGLREDIVTVYTPAAEENSVIQGKMHCTLTVSSDCEDTCFYVRVCIEKPQGDYGLRDDITSLCYQLGDYWPNTKVKLQFTFDDISFLLKKGERLRVDISSADREHYVRHTNQKGLYSQITDTKIANNTVWLGESQLQLPIRPLTAQQQA